MASHQKTKSTRYFETSYRSLGQEYEANIRSLIDRVDILEEKTRKQGRQIELERNMRLNANRQKYEMEQKLNQSQRLQTSKIKQQTNEDDYDHTITEKEVIELETMLSSNDKKNAIYDRWILIFKLQIKHNVPFDHMIFTEMVKTHQYNPETAIQLKYDNYSTILTKKNYNSVLKSFIGWILTLKCQYFRCSTKFKLDCFCDINLHPFQLFAYYFIIGLIKCDLNHDDSQLNALTNITNNISTIANNLCGILCEELQNQTYFQTFTKYIITWLQYEFYNFVCADNICASINKTIMLNRIYEYSISLNYCRLCNALQLSRIAQNPNQQKFDMVRAIQQRPPPQSTAFPDEFKSESFEKYIIGPSIRYTVIQPKYCSFAQEILLNEIYSLSLEQWKKCLHKTYAAYTQLTVQSTETNINYGIEQYEKIGIHHFIAIRLFCFYTEYATEFSKSYHSDLQVMCNNFYWFGRYLYEAVQFHGVNTNQIAKPLYHSLPISVKFDSFAPMIHHSLITSGNSDHIDAESKGMILQISAKYCGEIDHSKAISLRTLIKMKKAQKSDLWLFSGACNMQLNVVYDNANCYGLALMYLEKIFTQNIFDCHFYNDCEPNNLYDDNVMHAAVELLALNTSNKHIKCPPHIMSLFRHWCQAKTVLYFDAILLEKDKMSKDLQYIIFSETEHKIEVKIAELRKTVFPNLTSYYDINGALKFKFNDGPYTYLKQKSLNQQQNLFRPLYKSKAVDMPQHIVDALKYLRFQFKDRQQFKAQNHDLFDKFTAALAKDQVTVFELERIATSSGLFNDDMSGSLAQYLFVKVLEDREKMKKWICTHCSYLNKKIMVGGLYRLYNQISCCGLCGCQRYTNEQNAAQCTENISFPTNDKYALPDEIFDDWNEVHHKSKCLLLTFENISHKQLIHVLRNHLFDRLIIKKESKKLLFNQYKENIIEYFKTYKINGYEFMKLPKKPFVNQIKKYCNNNNLTPLISKLYASIKQCDYDKISDMPNNEDDVKEAYTNDEKYDESLNLCTAMKRLHIVLQYFERLTANLANTHNTYPHTIQQFLQSLPDYGVVELLNDTQHIIRHQTHRLCKNGKACVLLKRASRSRDNDSNLTQNDKLLLFNTNIASDCIYISMLDEAHVLSTHSKYDIVTDTFVKSLAKNVTDIQQYHANCNREKQLSVFNTGVYINYVQTIPLYPNLKHEITRNVLHSISTEQFEDELKSSKFFMKTNNVVNKWRASKTDKHHGIQMDESIQIQHILCIKLYCNYTALCTKFRESHYKQIIYNDTEEIMIRRHCENFYWFGRFLTNAIEFYGVSPKNAKKKFYHGLSGKFKFNQFSAIFEIPTSTTTDIKIAEKFMKDGVGIVLQLSPKYSKEISFAKCLNVSSLSDFKAENEFLFAGKTVLAITNIYSPTDNQWNGYSKYVKAMLYFERITEQNIHQKQYYNYGVITDNTMDEWIEIQNEYLIPVIQHQMKRNIKIINTDIPPYICSLIQHFFDTKTIIDLSCIQSEVKYMNATLRDILFENIIIDDDGTTEYEINNENLKLIFPNLEQYKHYSGYWTNLNKVSTANGFHKSISAQQTEIVEIDAKKRKTISDFSTELQVLQKLILTKESSDHYFDYYVKARRKWSSIIKKNDFEPMIRIGSAKMSQILTLYETAVEISNKLKNDEEKTNFSFPIVLSLAAKMVGIKEIDSRIYRKMVNTPEWNDCVESNALQLLLEYDAEKIQIERERSESNATTTSDIDGYTKSLPIRHTGVHTKMLTALVEGDQMNIGSALDIKVQTPPSVSSIPTLHHNHIQYKIVKKKKKATLKYKIVKKKKSHATLKYNIIKKKKLQNQ